MVRTLLSSLSLVGVVALSGCSWISSLVCPTQFTEKDLGGDYRKVSDLVKFPDFYPGLGILYVQPKTIPFGPFEAFDRDGTLVATVYMVPIADFDAHRTVAGLPAPPVRVDHVDIYFNSGHPGVEMPHYHIVLWHVSRERAETLQ